jgi:hypothetical protein
MHIDCTGNVSRVVISTASLWIAKSKATIEDNPTGIGQMVGELMG